VKLTDDTTIDDEYEIQRLDALSDDWRDLAGQHEIDQLEATPAYAERYAPQEEDWTWT